LVALAAASACSDYGAKTEPARKIFAIVDRQFQECVFGAEIPPGELGRTEVIAQVTGALDAHRVYSCAEVTRTRYEAVPGYGNADVAPLIAPFRIESDPLSHEGFGVCDHLSSVRAAARKLGIDAPDPDCSSHRDPLPGIAEYDPVGASHAYRDRLALVDGKPSLRLHRTQDGTTWDSSPPVLTSRIYVSGARDAFAYTYPSGKNSVRHYIVPDGDSWHVGSAVVGWDVVSFRRTTSGWCIVTVDEATDTPLVLQLDPLMDHVTARTPVPALRGRWSRRSLRAALIDKQGNVSALVATVGPDSTSLESHVVSVTGKVAPPRTTKLDNVSTDAEVWTCHASDAEYVVLAHIGSLLTTDGGRAFTELEGGKGDRPFAIDCTDAHLFVATERDFESCDHQRCSHTPMPLQKDVMTSIALNVSGEQPQLFASYEDVAFMATPSGKDGILRVSHIWRIEDSGIAPIVRIDGLWFAPRVIY
jgi:hypothetical protein